MGAAKGTIQANHFPNNNYKLLVPGLGELTVLAIAGLDIETETVEMPDRTVVSGGHHKTLEFTVKTPTHHTAEQAAWQIWHKMSTYPVLPGYKKPVTLVQTSLEGSVLKLWELVGCFPSKLGLSDLEMKDEGNLSEITHTCKADDFLPIPG